MRYTVSRVAAASAAIALMFGGLSYAIGQSGQQKGAVVLDGSSTVAPISKAAAQLFSKENSAVNVAVGISGTGGGFKKFLESDAKLRTDINAASRPILPEEQKRAKEVGVEYLELPIAYDGMAVVVHPSNTFCEYLTVAELKAIWEPGSKVNNWKDIRPGFPDLPLKLYGADSDSGTFDYFTEVICGKAKASRGDYTPASDDNMLVHGVSGDKGALGYFGFSYYEANTEKLKLLAIDNGDGRKVKPTIESIRTLEYRPLARPLFYYVNAESSKRPEVRSFVEFVLKNPASIVQHKRVGYIALSDALYVKVRERLEKNVTGTLYSDVAMHTKSLYELYGLK